MSDTRSDTRLWHPFADMGAVRHRELMITRGEDVWVWDDQGRQYLDAFASLWYANIGHGRREVIDAVHQQMLALESYTTFFDYVNPPAAELAERLALLSGLPDAKVIFGSGGGDAIDTAAKLARRFFHETGRPERTHLISRTQGYHGTHGYGTALAGIPLNRVGWGPLAEGASVVANDSVQALAAEIELVGPERVAAFFCEPVIGSGGVIAPPDGYLRAARELCRRHEILFVCDAVICGFGRLGTWFGIERWDVQPDLIVFAKGVTSGYLPLGGVIVHGAVAEPFWAQPGAPVFRHGPTYSGHPACCAAGLANLDVLEADGLLGASQVAEEHLAHSLAALRDDPAVATVRAGTGLMAAVELEGELVARVPDAGQRVVASMRAGGVLVRALGPDLIAVCPPLTMSQEHAALIGSAFTEAVATLGALV